jgi:hypothetical protein
VSYTEWVKGPFGLDAAKGMTVRGQRKVLAVVHHLAAGTRLADVLPMLESDRRIQVVFTTPPASIFTRGTAEYLRGLGGLVLPWGQATQLSFDLAVAAGTGMLEQLHAPVMTIPHGSGQGSLLRRRVVGLGPSAARPVSGLLPERLVVGGRVVPSVFVVPHERQRRLIEQRCPEALPVVVVGGDPCFDRLAASGGLRDCYRRALNVDRGQQLVLVSSTWNEESSLGRHPDLLFRLATELPPEKFRIAAVLHPNVWSWHGRRQVTAWQADCLQLGVRLIPPEEGWRAAAVAADRIIGDSGSVTYYGAALGVPVLLAAFPDDRIPPGSHVGRLGSIAPRLDWDKPVEPQLDDAVHAYNADVHTGLRDLLTSKPGESAGIIRREMYRLMRLAEPERPPRVHPVPPPSPIPFEGDRAA